MCTRTARRISSFPPEAEPPLPIRTVVVTMYETAAEGAGSEHYGEFRLWVERLPLPERLVFPAGLRQLRYNPEKACSALLVASVPCG
jgi:hypothetical protein